MARKAGLFWFGGMLIGAVACAQTYPNKPLRIITGATGGGSDVVSRLLATPLSIALGQPVVVENRTAIVAADVAFRAPPDGYSLHINGNILITTPLLQPTPYDVLRDFASVCQISRNVNVLAIHPSVQANSVKELIALAKANPGKLNYASTGTGGNQHIGGELFKSLAGVNFVRVAYKGGAFATQGLLGGEVQMLVNDAGVLVPLSKTGKLKALAVTSATPSVMAPGLPTVAAAGVPGYEWVSLTGVWVPAKTPTAIIRRLNQEIVRVINAPDTKDRLFNIGEELVASSPEEFTETTKSFTAKLGKLIKDTGIKAD